MTSTASAEHLDILVIGAGISGIGAGYYITTELPSKSFAILEGRASFGGTWDLHKYPGIRSDSDLHTFGYEFKPWKSRDSIADGHKIIAYLRETIEENGLTNKIRYRHKVVSADWSNADAQWTVQVERTDTGERIAFTAKWVIFGSGYYDYEQGFTPEFAGRARFTGQIIHPQFWPEDLDYSGKKVVVIGSGATAVTLVPSLATGPSQAAQVTMLQRTPSYVMPVPKQDPVTNLLHRVFGHKLGHELSRRRFIWQQRGVYAFTQRFPSAARKIIRFENARRLPRDFPIDVHFNPPYAPWDQRLCAVPDGDLFAAICSGKASVVTDQIENFTETGIALQSGEHLDADIVVTATGFNLKLFGGVTLSIEGEPVDITKSVIHRGAMLSGIPNVAIVIGYVFSSWTLKVGPLFRYFTKLIQTMDAQGADVAVVLADPHMTTRPALDFEAGYVQRALHDLPRQGTGDEWSLPTTFWGNDECLHQDLTFDETSALRMYASRSRTLETTHN
ncbi:monooxygenase-like flavoprotein [Mycobacteroides abscessus subsp. massiliense]|uniref:flavin-containing monooxygenase n=1 Tax=Mycobacteroides abscessus TaxID=36809 RepID=UPI0009A652C3|nr:NAD(P)/FAD-dependent oxidoreductase [Mycobacteroides abscessus]SKF28412.1 monooxygenase-like flavoprotein [Mycobacteroides abscessus subsp. abscessus]SKH49458.1 monooxygenase-like flavoprotein [Mycobacteroides abscessus subsp. massiliense]SKH82474.1 monooxygenase-like flavoprotein [Mycobacteroides abscessus subsp. massiliense]SKK36089.1 monooxygenase-like flavoprotein [Mycobacteroides abscessus subsp. massiliense]SKK43596.1 monooxygenase-like flavoprotein [Mycobacteroides abscessus subsp. m